VTRAAPLVDEVANELDTWPGVHVETQPDGTHAVLYEQLVLGVLDRERALAELRFDSTEHDDLVDDGAAEPADPADPDSNVVSHAVDGPSDVTAVLELFDRRYREVRGEGEPHSSQDPA